MGIFYWASWRGLGVVLLSTSHILFADDTLIFCEANLEHIRSLPSLFLCFEAVSGLRINMAKLVLVSVGNVMNVEGLASILGCRVSSLPIKYLGLPLGASFKANFIWDDIIEKVERRLADLSKGGWESYLDFFIFFISKKPISLKSVRCPLEHSQQSPYTGFCSLNLGKIPRKSPTEDTQNFSIP